ncbi:1-acyl-sn-glycerol-3-phosphate acyltransferase [Lachnospiraceae bacterium OttesenSCG-928-E19]|nr:1-acyl-sn-glycerol-3-phosphate acyltransferase [Lachnospiraceae bacterium OttesenSCG-928-E19]
MIRFILVAIILVLFLVGFIPVLIVEWIIGKFNPYARDISSLRLVQGAFKLMLFITGVELTVIGEENVPKDEAVLYIGNHRSFFDILITYSRCPRLTGYVAKKEMKKIPLLSTWMNRLYCLYMDRTSPKEGLKTILKAIEHVKNGISICIFPEGTRNKGDELSMLDFKDGALKIAEKSGCAIIPMSLNNTAEIFENHFPRIKKTQVILEYGTPIYPKELDKETKKHLGNHCQALIQETINKNASLLVAK